VGAITVNQLVLLGACFIQGGHHSRAIRYPMIMALIHARALPAGLVLSAYAVVSNAGSEGKECIPLASRRRLPCSTVPRGKNALVFCMTAVLLVLYFAAHVAFVCNLHSHVSLAIRGLLSMLSRRDRNMRVDYRNSELLPSSFSGRISVSHIWHLRDHKELWLRGRLSLDKTDSEPNRRGPSDSATLVLTLLFCCSAILFLCIQSVDTLAHTNARSWRSSLHAGYVLFPLTTSAAGLMAVQLHGCCCKSAIFHGQILLASVLSTMHLLCFALPVFVLTRWAIAPGSSLEFFDVHQLGLLALALLLPLYPMQRGSDDWYVCSHLLKRKLTFASGTWAWPCCSSMYFLQLVFGECNDLCATIYTSS
jgi:hypothetical protein